MAIRKIEYTVTADGLSPSVKQFGGVQGDHKATEIVFEISAFLYGTLSEQAASGGELIYRFDGYDGEGGMCRSDTKALPEEIEDEPIQVVYPLEEWITRYGGIVRVVLVISLSKDDLTEMELYSFPAILQLKNLPSGDNVSGESYESMSVLAQVAKDSAEIAVEAKKTAVTAQVKTEEARAALEGDTEWIFDGGDASVGVEIDLVIDGEMSDESTNPVQNKVAKAYTDKARAESEKILKQYVDDKYPVGSIWIGGKYEEPVINFDTGEVIHAAGEPINPADIFGGEWENQTVKATYHGTTYMFPNGASAGDSEEITVEIPESVKISTARFQLTCHTGGPQARSVSTIGTTYDTNGYLTKFVIKAYTSSVVGAGGTPIYYMVAGDSPQDENGYYYWKRIEPTEVTE